MLAGGPVAVRPSTDATRFGMARLVPFRSVVPISPEGRRGPRDEHRNS